MQRTDCGDLIALQCTFIRRLLSIRAYASALPINGTEPNLATTMKSLKAEDARLQGHLQSDELVHGVGVAKPTVKAW